MSDRLVAIGITGVARSGKDTVAGILCQRFGFTRVALADGVRSAFRDIDGPTWEATKALESAGKSSRWALQQLGTEARLYSGHDGLWIGLVLAKIAYLYACHPARRFRFVIPDVRFVEEAENFRNTIPLILDANGAFHLWGVSRPGSGLSGDAAIHASERGVRSIEPDLAISNGGSIADLESIVCRYAGLILDGSAP